MEDTNTGSIFNADAEMDAQDDGDENIEADKKNDGNKEVLDTSLERKKRKRKDNRTTAQRLRRRKEIEKLTIDLS